ncbi:MAG: pyruvate, water dikinase [Proteobacteria bacterium]|nr:pyruvate, water dikinase [Pseudomonadota bacterium]
MQLPKWLDRLLFRNKQPKRSIEETEKLNAEFQVHYHHFKLLLAANTKALEIMSEIEESLAGGRPFGMNYVRVRCCRVFVNVYQIIRHFDEISEKKYTRLYDKLFEVQKQISPYLTYSSRAQESPLAVPIAEVDRGMLDQVGSKMANLGELKQRLGVNVPRGYVMTARAFWNFMNHESLQTKINKTIQSMDPESLEHLYDISETIRDLIYRAPFPPELAESITESYRSLEKDCGEDVKVAVRSSSQIEDLPGMSVAGQYHTELNVTGDGILDAYQKVVASKYSYQSMVFRLNFGIRDADVAMSVGLMPMVDAALGGVVYTKDPVRGIHDNLSIYSVQGLPQAVVEGTGSTDRFVVSRNAPMQIIEKKLYEKASLEDDTVIEVAKLALDIEDYYGSAQDIEWVRDKNDSIIILQSRPLTQRKKQQHENKKNEGLDRKETVILEGGVTASPGMAAGPAVVVQSEKDVLRFPEGGVLVARQALPIWAAVLSRAVAVVAENGSAAGHLASVARECEVPALLGVKDAVSKLSSEDIVTVDADEMKVHVGRVGTPSQLPKAPISHIQGSPVYESLKDASKYIHPLNLLDPESADFRPSKCKTLHDITRFCHEKVVHEMFEFGVEHHFSERSSKQLRLDVPMQYWIIDLDDGFSKEAPNDSRYIRLEHIVSVPMLALWRGMVKIPWRGPPQVNAGGFLSVLANSATDNQLLSSMPSRYANRNYFMLSKDFVSMQSRLGYHFSTVEAFVGKREAENYLSFSLKGGAASYERKVLRARLAAEVLEEMGFHTKLVQDSMTARLEGHGREHMESRLEIVGYLTIHVRQLDMVMSNESSLKKYKTRLLADIEKLSSTD